MYGFLRYEYNYTNLGTSYAGGTQTAPGAIGINFISGVSTTETTNYIIHPAFRNGSVTYTNHAYTTTTPYQMGGWYKELTGFWYGKFETGVATKNTINKVLTYNILVKPNVTALTFQNVSNQYLTALNVSGDHGVMLDSHTSKNSEWGTVAYLSQSIYVNIVIQIILGQTKKFI